MAIPSETPPNLPKKHIDTVILRGMLDTTEKDEYYDIGRHLANSTKRTDPLGVSIPTIGEAFHGLCADLDSRESSVCGDAAIRLKNLVEMGKIVLIGLGGKNRVYTIVRELLDVDDRLGTTDAIILSTACNYDPCSVFYTTDGTMAESISIAEVAKNYGVKILEPPFSGR